MQPFWMEVLINLLLDIMCFVKRPEIRLKYSFPYKFKREIGRKSFIFSGQGDLFLGM